MKVSFASRLGKALTILWALIVPAPLVLVYAIAGVFFGFGTLLPVRMPFEERTMNFFSCAWCIAGALGFVSVWSAMTKSACAAFSKKEIAGLSCGLIAFGGLIYSWLFEELPRARVLSVVSFWPLVFLGPAIVGLFFLVHVVFPKEKEAPNQTPEPTAPSGRGSS